MAIINFTAKQQDQLNRISILTKKMGFGVKINQMITAINRLEADPSVEGTPVNAVNAAKALAITGVVIEGETVSINNPAVAGTDVYEFIAGGSAAAGNIAVDITASTVKATDNLTVDTQPTSGDTMTIGTKAYIFVPNGTANADGEISVGTDLATAQANIVAAINGTDTVNDPHPSVTAGAFAANVSAITAITGGAAGNDIATTETFTAASNIFSAAKLATGADCTAANAITALVTAVTASDTQGVGAADGAGDTVDFTADTAGVIGNAIIIAETMANGAFTAGATTLSGGVNGTVGLKGDTKMDESYLYKCVADNTIAGKNWRRISLGSAY